MKNKLILTCLTALLSVIPALPATLTLNASAVSGGALYNYSYDFSVTGTGLSFDNIFLGSDDLSPLNLAFTLNGAATGNWSWLGNDTPQNYLQFYSLNGNTLPLGGILRVTFTSAFTPGATHFAEALNSSTSTVSNVITGVAAPTAVPEPASFWLLLIALPTASAIAPVSRRLRNGKRNIAGN